MGSVRDILRDERFAFKKGYGQNFILDENLLAAIAADAGVAPDDTVVEVGAGAGTLTRVLSTRARRVIAFEIDETLKPVLTKTLADQYNIELHFRDILKTPREELEQLCGGAYRVVANLPYYITTPVLFYFLDAPGGLQSMSVMVQREVAERMAASPKQGDYGALSAVLALKSRVRIVRLVPRQAFLPSPAVDSALVRLDIKPLSEQPPPETFRVIKAAFAMRRKTLLNTLSGGLALSREQVSAALNGIGIDSGRRAEELEPEQFTEIARALYMV